MWEVGGSELPVVVFAAYRSVVYIHGSETWAPYIKQKRCLNSFTSITSEEFQMTPGIIWQGCDPNNGDLVQVICSAYAVISKPSVSWIDSGQVQKYMWGSDRPSLDSQTKQVVADTNGRYKD